MGPFSREMGRNQQPKGAFHGIFMGFSWDFHGIFMGFSWDFTMKSGDLMGSNGI